MTGSLLQDRMAGGDPIAGVVVTIMRRRRVVEHGPPGVNAVPGV
jgi:hypothetical protein